jgi:hypothetical protein
MHYDTRRIAIERQKEKESFFLTGHIQCKHSLSPRSLELRGNFQMHRWSYIWSVLLLYAGAHKISLKYLFPEKMFIEICCQKCQKCNIICVTTFFYWISIPNDCMSFYFQVGWGGGGVVWGWLYLINSLQKNKKKTQKTQTATQLYC